MRAKIAGAAAGAAVSARPNGAAAAESAAIATRHSCSTRRATRVPSTWAARATTAAPRPRCSRRASKELSSRTLRPGLRAPSRAWPMRIVPRFVCVTAVASCCPGCQTAATRPNARTTAMTVARATLPSGRPSATLRNPPVAATVSCRGPQLRGRTGPCGWAVHSPAAPTTQAGAFICVGRARHSLPRLRRRPRRRRPRRRRPRSRRLRLARRRRRRRRLPACCERARTAGTAATAAGRARRSGAAAAVSAARATRCSRTRRASTARCTSAARATTVARRPPSLKRASLTRRLRKASRRRPSRAPQPAWRTTRAVRPSTLAGAAASCCTWLKTSCLQHLRRLGAKC